MMKTYEYQACKQYFFWVHGVSHSSQLGGFSITMSKIIEWDDLQGLHGFATGNSKKLKVTWGWWEFQQFFILWSNLVAGVKPEGNVDKTYTLRAKDVIAKEPRKSKKPAEDVGEFARGGWSGFGMFLSWDPSQMTTCHPKIHIGMRCSTILPLLPPSSTLMSLFSCTITLRSRNIQSTIHKC